MSIAIEVLATREGVLLYPDQAAAEIADGGTFDPLEATNQVTYEVLSTRAGVLRFPDQAAARIAEVNASSLV